MHNRTGSWRTITAVLAMAVLVPACTAKTTQTPVEVNRVNHRKFDNAVEIKSEQTRAVVVPQCAGRLSVLDFGGGNVLFSDPKIDGNILKPADGWAPWDGNATDIASTDGKSQWKQLWLHAWPEVNVGERNVEIASETNPQINLSAVKRYALAGDGKSLQYSYTLVPHGNVESGWTIWERALMVGDYAVAPLSSGGPSEKGYIVRDNAKVDPADRLESRDGFLIVRPGVRKGVGIAARLRSGWMALVRGDHVLLMQYPIEPAGNYPHFNGANAVFYIAADKVEMEPMSAEHTFADGESYTFPQTWSWLAIPQNVDGNDPVAVGRWLADR